MSLIRVAICPPLRKLIIFCVSLLNNNIIGMEICFIDEETKDKTSGYVAKDTNFETIATKNNNCDGVNYRLIEENKNIKNVKRLVKVQGSLNRFAASHRGDIIITVKFNPNKCSTKEVRNFLKIIDKLDIMERFTRRKGVISDWDLSLQKFSEALDDNNKTKVYDWKDTSNIVVTFEGNELPVQLSLFDGLTFIRVKPYIPTVKQCYKYDHIKQFCKKEYIAYVLFVVRNLMVIVINEYNVLIAAENIKLILKTAEYMNIIEIFNIYTLRIVFQLMKQKKYYQVEIKYIRIQWLHSED
ncbi:hypothetical protein ACFW04_013873 [Cataglyphis niger]